MEPLELTFLSVEIKTPPVPPGVRREVGRRLRRLQSGQRLGMPHSRPMPSIGPRVHELRVGDGDSAWRVVYRVDPARLLVVDVFPKTTPKTPKHVVARCRQRLQRYDSLEGRG